MSSVPQSILCRKLWAALRPLLDCIGGVGLGVGKAGTCAGGVGGPWFFCAAVSVYCMEKLEVCFAGQLWRQWILEYKPHCDS